MEKKKWIPNYAAAGLLLALFLCVTGCGHETAYLQLDAASEAADAVSVPADTETAEEHPEPEVPAMIWVYVCGAVRTPGVYELPAESRLFQALEAAGGMTEEAEERSLNQAAVLSDGEQIIVYTKEEIASGLGPQSTGAAGGSSGSGKVNLNTAGKEELMTLSGIGESRAAAILAYREQNGSFSSIEEIMNIDGIKEKSFEKIREYIEV